MNTDAIIKFIDLTPAELIDRLDALLVKRNIFPDLAETSQYQFGTTDSRMARTVYPQSLVVPSFFSENPQEKLAMQLLTLSRQNRISAMRAIAPFIGSLGYEMLSGFTKPTAAMLYLADPDPKRIIDPNKKPDPHQGSGHYRLSDPRMLSPWSRQARAIIDVGDELLDLYDAPNLDTFIVLFKEMNSLLLQGLLVPLFYRRGKPLDLSEVFEQAGAIAWGPLEVARVLFENKFKAELSKNKDFAKDIYEELVVSAVRELEHAVLCTHSLELAIHLRRSIHFGRRIKPHLLGPRLVQTAFVFGLNLFQNNIMLDVDVPAGLSFRPDFPVADSRAVLSMFKQLLDFVRALRDPQKDESFINISWISKGPAIAIADNGIGIQDVKAIWPFGLSPERAINSSLPIAPSLIGPRDILKNLGWRMTLDSRPKEGLCFKVYPLLGDVIDPNALRQPQHVSGPPQYGADPEIEEVDSSDTTSFSAPATAAETPEIEAAEVDAAEEIALLEEFGAIEMEPLAGGTKVR